jgi:hypothetical protein
LYTLAAKIPITFFICYNHPELAREGEEEIERGQEDDRPDKVH